MAVDVIVDNLRYRPALLWEGRSPQDVEIDTDGRIRTLLEILRRRLREELGLVVLFYSRATGLIWDTPDLQDFAIRQPVCHALQAHGLLDQAGQAFVAEDPARFLRAAYMLLRTPPGAQWPDGRPLRFCLFVHFTDHLCPPDISSMSEEELRAAEWASLLSSSLAMRTHGHRLLLYASDAGRVHAEVRAMLCTVRVPQPNREVKEQFIRGARAHFPEARTADGLDWDLMARLSANTPNLSMLDLLSHSHTTRKAICHEEVLRQRTHDVASISEGLLTPMEDVEECLFGQNILHAWSLLERIAQGLRQADPNTPHNVLLVGPPGSGKTALAQRLAREAGVPAYRINSPKHSLVGETERRSRLLFELLHEWSPTVGFIDEITEAFPTERGEMDLDAGASRAVMGAMLAYLGDEGRCGRTVLVAATNCPWRMGAALRSRFVVIPVLMPPLDDYPAIVAGLARRVLGIDISPDDPHVREAASEFYARAASPRHIIKAFKNLRLLGNGPEPDLIARAARSFCGDTSPEAAALADLWAVKLTDCTEFYPWKARQDYPFPHHLMGVVRPDGSVDHAELDRRIAALAPGVSM